MHLDIAAAPSTMARMDGPLSKITLSHLNLWWDTRIFSEKLEQTRVGMYDAMSSAVQWGCLKPIQLTEKGGCLHNTNA